MEFLASVAQAVHDHPIISITAFAGLAPIVAIVTLTLKNAAQSAARQAVGWLIEEKIASDVQTAETVLLYLSKHGRSFSVARETYDARQMFVKSKDRDRLVMFRQTIASHRAFLYRGRLIVFSPQHMTTGNGGTSVTGPRFIFLRGSVNWLDLIAKAAVYYSDVHITDEDEDTKGNGFRVVRHVGNANKRAYNASGGVFDNNTPPPTKKGGGGYILDPASTDKPIGYELDDLGPLPAEDPLGQLSIGAELEEVIRDVKFWYSHRKWHEERGLPWRRGVLLHGKPGTGKTSCVRALAQDLELPVHTFDLVSMDNEDFLSAWAQAKDDGVRVVLLEDFDAIFHGRENVLGSPLSFDTILNVLDGVEREHGLLLFVTTNNVEHIDTAMGTLGPDGKSTRPGRIDLVVELKGLDAAGRYKVALRIIKDDLLAKEMADKGEGMTAATFQELCMQRALADLWSEPAKGAE